LVIKRSRALAPPKQWCEQRRWLETYDHLWQRLREPHGKQEGTRQMIELLQLGRPHRWERLRDAIEHALHLGCTDAAAVRHLLTTGALQRGKPPLCEIGLLEQYERPLPVLGEYDALLHEAVRS
jgi:hypothetical protein